MKNKKSKKESFASGVKKELKLVKWPTLKEVAKYSLATVIFSLFLAGFFLLVDFVMSLIKGAF